jgi:hypothetical protein
MPSCDWMASSSAFCSALAFSRLTTLIRLTLILQVDSGVWRSARCDACGACA